MTKQAIVEVLTKTDYSLPLSPRQGLVLSRISRCRTASMGGRISRCERCHAKDVMYYSCRDRHCPQCQSLAKAKWLEDRSSELLPVNYYHVVFTLPHELNPLARVNPELIYSLLYRASWKTIKTLGADKKRLNGQMGMTAILHTWGQQLNQHIHLHCIVPGGALSEDRKHWHKAKSTYLFPVKAMSRYFRGAYVALLREAFERKKMKFCGQCEYLAERKYFDELLDGLMSKEWVVYCKKPLTSGKPVLNYLSQYTHKIAISHHRIIASNEHQVTFSWKDYSDGDKKKKVTMDRQEFLRRFLLHVLPSGFMRIRHYGYLGNRFKRKNLDEIRRILKAAPMIRGSSAVPSFIEQLHKLTGVNLKSCKQCKTGQMQVIVDIPKCSILAPDK